MKAVPEIKQELRNALPLIGIKDTILAIKKYLPEHAEKFNSLLLIEGRYRDIEQRMLQGVLSLEDVQLETNKIRADLLTFIDSFEESDFQAETAEPVEPPKAKSGKILYRIPDTMQVNEKTKCIIRVAFTEETLLEDLEIESIDQIKSIRISEAMAAQVIDPNSEKAFEITTFSEKIQFVEEDYFTEWLFFVKPLLKGTFSLLLKISVIEIKMGKERKRDIVMEEKVVITTEAVAEEPPFKSANYDFVSPYAPIQTRGIEPTPVPSPSKPGKKRAVVGLSRAIASIGKILMIGGLVIGSIAVLNYGFNSKDISGGDGLAENIPAPPPGLEIPTFPKPAQPDAVVVYPEPEIAAVETQTISEYKEDLIAYVDKHKEDTAYRDELAKLRKEIQYLEYQEAVLDSTSVEVLDYIDKYAADSLNCLYCRPAEELKMYRVGQEEWRGKTGKKALGELQKIDGLLRYLETYPKGKYRIPAIKAVEKVKPDAEFPIVVDALKWDRKLLELTFLKGEPPFKIDIQLSNNEADTVRKKKPPFITINDKKPPIVIPFEVPNLERDKYDLVIEDNRGKKTLLPLNKMTVDSIGNIKPTLNDPTDTVEVGILGSTGDTIFNPIAGIDVPKINEKEKTRLAELEKKRLADVEKTRLAELEKKRLAEIERKRLAEIAKKEAAATNKILSKLPGEILVKKGKFTMGSNVGDEHEKPVHSVNIQRNFYIRATEMTFTTYDAYCNETGASKPNDNGWGRGNRPVVNVSWLDAVKYCNWLTSKYPQLSPVYNIKGNKVKINPTANGFRLPTEAEWEYAAKGGHRLKNSHKYAGSFNDWKSVAYHGSKTGQVKSKTPNSLGIYDMSGNVYEWTQDYWVENYNNTPKDGSAFLKNKNYDEHTIRGGRFNSNKILLRVTHRTQEPQNAKREGVGFRVVRFTY